MIDVRAHDVQQAQQQLNMHGRWFGGGLIWAKNNSHFAYAATAATNNNNIARAPKYTDIKSYDGWMRRGLAAPEGTQPTAIAGTSQDQKIKRLMVVLKLAQLLRVGGGWHAKSISSVVSREQSFRLLATAAVLRLDWLHAAIQQGTHTHAEQATAEVNNPRPCPVSQRHTRKNVQHVGPSLFSVYL